MDDEQRKKFASLVHSNLVIAIQTFEVFHFADENAALHGALDGKDPANTYNVIINALLRDCTGALARLFDKPRDTAKFDTFVKDAQCIPKASEMLKVLIENHSRAKGDLDRIKDFRNNFLSHSNVNQTDHGSAQIHALISATKLSILFAETVRFTYGQAPYDYGVLQKRVREHAQSFWELLTMGTKVKSSL
jgi:AbiU2